MSPTSTITHPVTGSKRTALQARRGMAKPAYGGHASFLDEFTIRHEPRAALGRFFLRAEQALEEMGLRLSFGPFATLASLYEQHAGTWGELVPLFDARACTQPPETSACFLGRNAAGELVTAIAVRHYDLTGTTLKAEMESQRFFFPGAEVDAGGPDQISVTAPSAAHITGSLSYSGAFWIRPDYRGRKLPWILPQIARNYAVSAWDIDCDLSVGKRGFLRPDVAAMYHYNHVEEAFHFERSGRIFYEGVLVMADRLQMDSDLARFAGTEMAPELILESGRTDDKVAARG